MKYLLKPRNASARNKRPWGSDEELSVQDTPGLDLKQGASPFHQLPQSLPAQGSLQGALGSLFRKSPASFPWTVFPKLRRSSFASLASLTEPFIHSQIFFLKYLLYTKTCWASKDAGMGQILTLGWPHLATSRPETIHGHFLKVLRSSWWEIIHSGLFWISSPY